MTSFKRRFRDDVQPFSFTLYDPATGELGAVLTVPMRDVDANVPDGMRVMLGKWDGTEWMVENDQPVRRPPAPAQPVEIWQVNAEAERRIVALYPIWKQMNLMRDGGEALVEMTAFIDRIRARSDALTARKSIPSTFRDDRYWD